MIDYAPYLGQVQLAPARPRVMASSARLGAASDVLSVAAPVVVTASIAASAYHGYKRNKSVGWAIWWALMGGIFPIVTPAIAFAQGFGKRARG